jgi:hypothetical protein
MSEFKKINLADLASTFEPIPDGEYEIRLTDIDPTVSAAGNDMIKATYTITKGPHKGSEILQWYVLKVTEKNGKLSCMGLSQMASIFKKIGVPEASYKVLDPEKTAAGRLFKKLVEGKTMEAFVTNEQRKDDPNKTSTRVNITGLVGGTVAAEEENEE